MKYNPTRREHLIEMHSMPNRKRRRIRHKKQERVVVKDINFNFNIGAAIGFIFSVFAANNSLYALLFLLLLFKIDFTKK